MTDKDDNKYQNGKIYKLVSQHTDEICVGSTIQSLNERKSQYKSHYKSWQENKFNRNLAGFEIVKYDDFEIELVELFPCESNKELEKREGYWIKILNNTINKRIAGRTDNEYYNDNKKHIQEYHKDYYLENIEKIKQYQQDNKKTIKDRRKNYYQEHRKNLKKECKFCGKSYSPDKIERHIKSIKHIKNFINY